VGSVLVVQLWAAQLPQREDTSIRINAARTLHSIPRSIYGTFLEPIGNSIYGGLWAEILQNPSFEANLWVPSQIADMIKERPELAKSSGMTLPLPWEPLPCGACFFAADDDVNEVRSAPQPETTKMTSNAMTATARAAAMVVMSVSRR